MEKKKYVVPQGKSYFYGSCLLQSLSNPNDVGLDGFDDNKNGEDTGDGDKTEDA